MQTPTLISLDYRRNNSEYFQRIRRLPFPSWLDSCAHKSGLKESRYDIITAEPSCMLIFQHQKTCKINPQGDWQLTDTPPLKALAEEIDRLTPLSSDMPFCGGALGYFGYELKSQLEPNHCPNTHLNNEPDMMVGIYLWALVSDHQKQCCHLVLHPELDPETKKRLLVLFTEQSAGIDTTPNRFQLTKPFSCDTRKSSYQKNFSTIQNYITAGDCYQINYTQRFSSLYQGDPFIAYQTLREISPAPFSAFLEFDQVTLLSHSPERFLSCDGDRIVSKPIKGTRPRGITAEADQKMIEELCSSSKDRAENLMIVDLLRNDLGRSCVPGTIKVAKLFSLESYANVHHLVSTIEGQRAQNTTLLELFANAFPGGSITGTPKIRAMEIIDQLEDHSRSVYCGSIGYISLGGQLDTSICIRTLLAHEGSIYCWGGGGIVADSECEAEREESFAKIRNLVKTLEKTLDSGQNAPAERDL